MTGAATTLPRQLRVTALLGLLGLALAVPFSAPDGTGMQWDELVLAGVSVSTLWMLLRRLRTMGRAAARPWWPMAVGAACFAISQLLLGSFPGPTFDQFGVPHAMLFVGALTPLLTCLIMALRIARTRWPALLVDGVLITVAVLAITEILRTPLRDVVGSPDDLRTLVLAYGAYSAVMLGGAGALCTVSTAALRRSATTMIAVMVCQAAAGGAEAMAIVAPSPLWVACSDLAVMTTLLVATLALYRAPVRFTDRSPRATAPVVTPIGVSLVAATLLGLPVAVAYTVIDGELPSLGARLAIAAVFVLIAVRLVLSIREDGLMVEHLVRSEEEFRELVESSSDGVVIVDDELKLLFTSPAARALLGLTGREEEVCLAELMDNGDKLLVRAALSDDGVPTIHAHVTDVDGTTRELELSSNPRPGGGRRLVYLRDVTTRRRRERELERMAYTDHLTGLPNRAMLYREMARDEDAEERCLLVLDLDGFKAVNDVAGHEAGDQLLVDVARRLHTVVRDEDLVSRLGGDEFAMLIHGTLEESVEVAQRIVEVMALPHRTGDWTFALGGSVGVAVLGASGGQVAFREADAALRAAKAAGKGCVRVADDTTSPTVDLDVAGALADGSLTITYDAACAPDGTVELLHAIPTWEHPSHGPIRGQELWGAAERQGISQDLQRWLFHRACAEAAQWPESAGVVVSLPAGHVSAEGLALEALGALDEAGLPASRLTISLTEETLLTSSAALVPELEAARRAGVSICLDNYGLGHSLFALLARVSLDYVRVDLAMLGGRDDTGRALELLAAIVHTSHRFGPVAVAGGLSTPELLAAAIEAGARLLQGRALPHRMSAADVAARLAVPVAAL